MLEDLRLTHQKRKKKKGRKKNNRDDQIKHLHIQNVTFKMLALSGLQLPFVLPV